jgi:AcrR family transcriptional regulator
MSKIVAEHQSFPRPRPQQRRSAETVTKILDTAAELLDEVGFDRLTTNLICERAGLTPPALYRHFANKYSVMEELGRRLMGVQNESLYRYLETQPDALLSRDALAAMLWGQYELTCQYPGGRWIIRSLHSMPALIHVRIESHQAVADYLGNRFLTLSPGHPEAEVGRIYRVAVEIGYAIIELLVDQPELDIEMVTQDGALMIHTLLSRP